MQLNRRKFLTILGAGAAAVAISPVIGQLLKTPIRKVQTLLGYKGRHRLDTGYVYAPYQTIVRHTFVNGVEVDNLTLL
jgi:hypothetical protein